MTTVADYVISFVESLGVKDVFLLTGGGAMYLNDALNRNKNMNKICMHHEQAAAMATVAYSKYTRNFGVAVVTTGCGVTNAITGLLDGYQDSVPCMFISGQVKRSETVANSGLKLRQFGVQEVDVIPVVSSLTKYAVMVNEPEEISYHLEKAAFLATSGRPGPVWIDIPLDVQCTKIKESSLIHFRRTELMPDYKEKPTDKEMVKFRELLVTAKRPIVVAGQGIAISGATEKLKNFVEHQGIPFVTTNLGINLLPTSHPLNTGKIGNRGDRAGNFAVQNSDLVISIGSRLSVSSLGQNYKAFARDAKVVVIDIDPVEHRKKTIRIDQFINADANEFFRSYRKMFTWFPKDQRWASKCQDWKYKWPVYNPDYADEKEINLYHFVDTLSRLMPDDATVISDAGSAFYAVSQGLKLKEGQRYIASAAQADMGFTLPASIGASIAKGGMVIGITGDGSFQLNIQELQTIVHYKLPIKLFVWNNNGYLSIRNTQMRCFDGRTIGTDKSNGVSFPSVANIATAYGIVFHRLKAGKEMEKEMKLVLEYPEAVICEVMCNPNQLISPIVVSAKDKNGQFVSKPMEDMFPFLDRKEFYREMFVKPMEESK